MPVGAQDIVLRFHDAGQRAHQNAAFAGEIAEDLALESRGKQVAGADADADGNAPFAGPSGRILLHCKARIDAGARQKITADGGA